LTSKRSTTTASQTHYSFQTSSEKIQSAQYGLVLLEEKEQLEVRCEELETLFEATRHDLHVAQEALAKFHSSQEVPTYLPTYVF
jgi:protein bicaudal D